MSLTRLISGVSLKLRHAQKTCANIGYNTLTHMVEKEVTYDTDIDKDFHAAGQMRSGSWGRK